MHIPRLEEAIEVCAKHLDQTNARNTEIEAFLTRYLLVLICATYEEQIERLVAKRALKVSDSHVSAFMQSATGNLIRGIRVSELSRFLGRFGDDYKQLFSAKVNDTDAHRAYDSIISNRHDTAHGPGAAMTFGELQRLFSDSLGVLDAFAEALGVLEDT